MDSTDIVRNLISVGKYRAAFQALPTADIRRVSSSSQLLKAEVLAIVGDTANATQIVENLRTVKTLSDVERSHLEYVRSFIALEQGAFEEELQHLQKSIYHADRAGDLERACWAQFCLGTHLADKPGPDALESLVTSMRTNAIKIGEPKITAALHILVGLIDAKRG